MANARDYQPAQLRRWVAALPYADPLVCSRALCEVTFAMAALTLPVDHRMQALACLAFGERRLVRDQTEAAALGQLQSVSHRRQLHTALRALALELVAGGRQVVAELGAMGGPQLARLAESMVFVARYLGHAIILDYQELNPPSRPLWQELHGLVLRAEAACVLEFPARDHDADAGGLSTVARAYLEVAATALADPYRMPYGMTWWAFSELRSWSEYAALVRSQTPQLGKGLFIVDLSSAEAPQPHFHARAPAGTDSTLRVIDLRGLAAPLAGALRNVREHDLPVASLPARAESVLRHLEIALSLPPKRALPREPRQGGIRLFPGFTAACHAAGQGLLQAGLDHSAATLDVAQEGEAWNFVNEGPGGYAVGSLMSSREPLDVGELVGVFEQRASRGQFSIGVVRWAMVQRSGNQLCGIQVIARRVSRVLLERREAGGTPMPALMYVRNQSLGLYGIVADAGQFRREEVYVVSGFPGAPIITLSGLRILEMNERFDYFEASAAAPLL